MNRLRESFNFAALQKEHYPLIGENYIFNPGKYTSLSGFEIAHEEVSFFDIAVSLYREYYLDSISAENSVLKITFTLAWNGFRDVLEQLFQYAESFESAIPVEKVKNTADEYEIGNFGLAWSWSDSKTPTYVAFLRNNLLVTLEGKSFGDDVLQVARELDQDLCRLDTIIEYPIQEDGFLSDFKRTVGLEAIESDSQVNFGKQSEDEILFFLTTSGSANRDYEDPNFWFYLSGEPGNHEINLFRADKGILPMREQAFIVIQEMEGKR